MHLASLDVFEFKSHEAGNFRFSPHINGLLGPNGAGKTNLLDAIHHLCLGRSAFSPIDRHQVRHGAAFYLVKGRFEAEGGSRAETVSCSYDAPSKRKTLQLDGKAYERISDHLGRFPVVFMSPLDADLVREGSDLRRRYFDSMLGQLRPHYLGLAIRYNQALKHRNALLRQFATQAPDPDLLLPYDQWLIDLGRQLSEARREALESFLPVFRQHYAQLSRGQEEASLHYQTHALAPGFADQFRQALDRDLALRYTTVGVHRDDYAFQLDGHPLKQVGSQGQQKSFVVALRLAQFDFMHEQGGRKPLLLMDDIFDKLDDRRMERLLTLLTEGHFGQVFITDARPERSRQLMAHVSPAPLLQEL
jgi:DNA replication and repair protein RecF